MFNNNPPYHNGMNYQADGRYIGNMLDNMNDDEFMNNDMMAGGELNPADQLNPMQPLYGDAQGYAQNYQQQPQQYDSSVYPPSSYGNRETDSFQQQHQHKSGVFGEIGERSWEEKEEKQEVEVVDHGPEFEKLSALVEQLPAKPLTGMWIERSL